MLPQENFRIRCSVVASEATFGPKNTAKIIFFQFHKDITALMNMKIGAPYPVTTHSTVIVAKS